MRNSTPKRAAANRKYLKLNESYLEENPNCARCGAPAEMIHHIVKGTAGRPASLCNPETWLPVCGGCHRWLHEAPEVDLKAELLIKVEYMLRTHNRLQGWVESAITIQDLVTEDLY